MAGDTQQKIDWSKPLQYMKPNTEVMYMGVQPTGVNGKPIKGPFKHMLITGGRFICYVNDYGQVKAPGKARGVQTVIYNKPEPKPKETPALAVEVKTATAVSTALEDAIGDLKDEMVELRGVFAKSVAKMAEVAGVLNGVSVQVAKQQTQLNEIVMRLSLEGKKPIAVVRGETLKDAMAAAGAINA